MHPNKKHIKILSQDMFKVNYPGYSTGNKLITIYIYVSPRFIPRIIEHIQGHFKHFDVVSYYYPIEKNSKFVSSGIHNLYKKDY